MPEEKICTAAGASHGIGEAAATGPGRLGATIGVNDLKSDVRNGAERSEPAIETVDRPGLHKGGWSTARPDERSRSDVAQEIDIDKSELEI